MSYVLNCKKKKNKHSDKCEEHLSKFTLKTKKTLTLELILIETEYY